MGQRSPSAREIIPVINRRGLRTGFDSTVTGFLGSPATAGGRASCVAAIPLQAQTITKKIMAIINCFVRFIFRSVGHVAVPRPKPNRNDSDRLRAKVLAVK